LTIHAFCVKIVNSTIGSQRGLRKAQETKPARSIEISTKTRKLARSKELSTRLHASSSHYRLSSFCGVPISRMFFQGLSTGCLVLTLLCTFCWLAADTSEAQALVRFDFEQKYYQHAGRQVWDFSMIRPDSIYHIFYHSILQQTPDRKSVV